MNRPNLKEFLEMYPYCPVCLECKPEIRKRKILIKARILGFTIEYDYLFITDLVCKQGHYELIFNKDFESTDNYEDVYIHFINLITADYDISICIPDNWIRISYGFKTEVERILHCDDYGKWMLPYEQMIEKLDKLWALA